MLHIENPPVMPDEIPASHQTAAAAAAPVLDADFIALLACPACDERPPLRLAPDRNAFHCERCGRAYAIRDGFPDLVPDDAVLPAAASSPSETADNGDK